MEFFWHHLPTILVLLPLIGAGTLGLVRGRSAIRWTAFGFLCAAVLLSLTAGLLVTGGGAGVPGIDGLSFPLAVMTTWVCLAAGLASWSASYSPRTHFVLLLCLEAGVLGTLLAASFVDFFICFELFVVPLGWMIENWHGSARPYAASKALVYKVPGAIALLIVGIGLNRCTGTMDLATLATQKSHALIAGLAFPFFVLAMVAFLIRLGAIPFHNWLADMQAQSPAPVAMILAGLVPMTGGYAILRIALPLFPSMAAAHWRFLAVLGLISIIYGALCSLAQKEIRKRLAYATISNLGFALLGIGLMNPASLGGAIYILLSQGLVGAMLVLAMGVDQDDFGGLAVFASIGIPGLCGFVGQFMVLMGTFQSPLLAYQAAALAVVACLGGLLNAASLLKSLRHAASEEEVEVQSKQYVALILLAAAIVALGILPAAILSFTGPAAAGIAKAVAQ